MRDTKEQKIIVLTELNDSDNNLILHGIKIASIFKKELCLFHNYKKKGKSEYGNIRRILNDYKRVVKNTFPTLPVSSLITEGDLTYLLDILTDDYDAILILVRAHSFKKHAKSVRESPLPFLFINTDNTKITNYTRIVAPIDLRKENSDIALWCSYFGRFNNSEIIAIAANDKNKANIRMVTKNIVLIKKLLVKFNISHKIYKGKSSSLRIQSEALEFARSSKSDLMIILGSSVITPIDLLIGLPEHKIIKKAENFPVLVINPRRDMYILCD